MNSKAEFQGYYSGVNANNTMQQTGSLLHL